MELILDIAVRITECLSVKGNASDVNMVRFTGTASGPFFNGAVIGSGTDTQKIKKDGSTVLSARYMLEGRDYQNESCRIFIENNSSGGGLTPVIVTDSRALAEWESAALSAEISPLEGGVNVRIYRL